MLLKPDKKESQYVRTKNKKLTIFIFTHLNIINPNKVRIVFKGNITDKSIKTHALQANLNVHRCIESLSHF